MRTLRTMLMTAAVCVLIGAAAPASADTDVPEEWLGVWELQTSSYDCETDELMFSSTALDTICPGSVFEDPDPDSVTVECTSSADGNSYTISCEGSEEALPGCIVNFTYEATGTRTNDSYMATSITTISYSGDCPVIPDYCVRTEITGTRIDSSTDPCTTSPVEALTWDEVKSLYR